MPHNTLVHCMYYKQHQIYRVRPVPMLLHHQATQKLYPHLNLFSMLFPAILYGLHLPPIVFLILKILPPLCKDNPDRTALPHG